MNLGASSLDYNVTHLGIFINCLDAIAKCTLQCGRVISRAVVTLLYL